MPTGTFFVRDCPTCGRKLEIRVELLGRDVECSHCGASFNSSHRKDDAELEINRVLDRAQKYIDSAQVINPAAAKLG